MSLAEIFYKFFLIGLFSIGGGYAIIPLIAKEVVYNNAWILESTFTDIITISQMTPGPLAVNTATFVGIQIKGILGAIVATVACVLAGIFIAISLYRFFKSNNSIYISEVLNGLKASSLGLIISAAGTILLLSFTGSSTITSKMNLDIIAIILFIISIFTLRKWKLNPILLIIVSGLIGIIVY